MLLLGRRSRLGVNVLGQGRNSIGHDNSDVSELQLQAGYRSHRDTGSVGLGDLDAQIVRYRVDNTSDGIRDSFNNIGSLVHREFAVDDTLLWLLHDNHAADLFIIHIELQLTRSVQLLDVDLSLHEVARCVRNEIDNTVNDTLALRLEARRSVQLVDEGGGVRLELGVALAPVLEALVGVAESLDALDRIGGVELASRGEEGVQWRVGRDGCTFGGLPAALSLVRTCEERFGGTDELPVGPEAVHVGVMQHAVGTCELMFVEAKNVSIFSQ